MVSVRLVLLAGMGAVLAATVACSSAAAAPIIIENGNSWARIDPYSQSGNDIWVVDGWNSLVKEWFWYRVDGPGGFSREASIDTLDPSPLVLPSDTSGDGVPDNLRLVYRSADQGLTVEINYNLLGAPPGSGRTDMAETVAVTNTGSAARTFHLFLYADYILSDGFDMAVAKWPNTVFQEFSPWHYAQAAVVPVPSHLEVNLEPLTLDALNDLLPTTLNDGAGPLTGNVAWAMEWDFTLAPRTSYLISENRVLTVVPEPATLCLLGVGVVGLLARCRRK